LIDELSKQYNQGAVMIPNENVVKGKWMEIKGDVRKAWGKLTDDELEKTKGDMQAIGGLIQQRYGQTKDHYEKKLSDIFQSFEEKKDKKTDEIKSHLKN
jgi:uncharacterized protein YjbJ (UPF0337 family)